MTPPEIGPAKTSPHGGGAIQRAAAVLAASGARQPSTVSDRPPFTAAPTDRHGLVRLPEMYFADPDDAGRRRRLEPVRLDRFVRRVDAGRWEGGIEIFLRDLDNSGILAVDPSLRFIASASGGEAVPGRDLVDSVFATERVTLASAAAGRAIRLVSNSCPDGCGFGPTAPSDLCQSEDLFPLR